VSGQKDKISKSRSFSNHESGPNETTTTLVEETLEVPQLSKHHLDIEYDKQEEGCGIDGLEIGYVGLREGWQRSRVVDSWGQGGVRDFVL
jgi:hypothetical protein